MGVAHEIGPLLSPGSIVIDNSTVPVGATRAIRQALQRVDVAVVSNPGVPARGNRVG